MNRPERVPRTTFLMASADGTADGPVPGDLVGTIVFDEPVPGTSVRTFGQMVPEGILGIAACRECGRREEVLVRLPSRRSGDEMDVGYAERQATSIRNRLRADWAGNHACGPCAFPTNVLVARDREVAVTMRLLDEGQPVSPRCVLVTSTGLIALHLPRIPDLPPPALDRLYADISHALREQRAAADVEAEGLIMIDAVRQTGGTTPALRALVATPARAFAGMARLRAGRTSGPRLGPWGWRALSGPCRPVDGVLATAIAAAGCE